MTSFVNVFVLVRKPATIKDSAHVPSSVCTVSRLRPVGAAAAAVVQFADINKGKFTHEYKSAMSLLVIDFTFSERWECELVDKELAAVDSHNNRVSSYVFKRPYGWEEIPSFKARVLLSGLYSCILYYHLYLFCFVVFYRTPVFDSICRAMRM